MSELSDVAELRVPSKVVREGFEFMRSVGRARLEGMVLWAGLQDGAIFNVTELIVPKQRGLRTADGLCAVVDESELRRLNVYLYRQSLTLVAQVHSHPAEAYHSSTDDQYAIATTVGCFSIVVPNFAVIDYALSECAAYRLNGNGNGDWVEIDETVAPNKIVVV